ncbi:MAG: phosphotransferase [Candidatus Hydrogenedentes bacterium]|nr:phosphotransferase [Candidatus Hydrogenedentota bacterium]
MHPDDYRFETRHGQSAYALHEEAGRVFGALFEGRNCVAATDVGRAAVQVFPLAHGEGIVRTYRRGGLAALFLRDRFLGNRMLREFEVHLAYYRAGGPVPELLGVCWECRDFLCRGAIATRRLVGETLLDGLIRADAAEAGEMLRLAGQAIRHMHDFGLWHADLQLKNMLVSERALWLIDFDRARQYRVLGRFGRARNLLRLRRSFEKHGRSRTDYETLLAGYGAIDIPWWLDWAYRMRGASAPMRSGS